MKILLLIISIALRTYSKLYQVVSLTRHGARYHVNSFGDGDHTKELWGELTAVGMSQHQNLGATFRKEYIETLKFISPVYTPSQIQVYSTPLNRTISSIQSQMYGLYPPGTGQTLPHVQQSVHLPPYSNTTDIKQEKFALPQGYQPIKIKLDPQIMLIDCPNFSKIEQKNFQQNADIVQEMNNTYYPFFKKLAPIFNFSISTASFYTMLRVMDCVNVDYHLGRPLPHGFRDEDARNVFHLGSWYFNIGMLGDNYLVFNSGKVGRILQVFDQRVQNPKTYPLKWTFLSGHDTDIISMYIGFNLSSAECIQQKWRKGKTSALNCEDGANYFASSLIFELHSDNEGINFYVKIRSNGKYVKMCNRNVYECQYSQFRKLAEKNIVKNVEELCGRKIKGSHQPALEKIQVQKPYLFQL